MFAEVGSKDADFIMAPYVWVEQIERDLEAGAWKVIAEARESGTAGIYRADGEVRTGLIDEIVHAVDPERLIFDAPLQRAAGVAADAVRHRVQPRQHRARGRALAGDAAARACARTPSSGSRWAATIDRRTTPTPADGPRRRRRGIGAGQRSARADRVRAAGARLLRRVLHHPTAQAHADRRAGFKLTPSFSPYPRGAHQTGARSRSSSRSADEVTVTIIDSQRRHRRDARARPSGGALQTVLAALERPPRHRPARGTLHGRPAGRTILLPAESRRARAAGRIPRARAACATRAATCSSPPQLHAGAPVSALSRRRRSRRRCRAPATLAAAAPAALRRDRAARRC